MRFTKLAVLLLAFVALSAFAAEPAPNPAKARAECKDAPPVMKHPADWKKAKREAFHRCMAGKGVQSRVIRAK